jgi:hypothetical protein
LKKHYLCFKSNLSICWSISPTPVTHYKTLKSRQPIYMQYSSAINRPVLSSTLLPPSLEDEGCNSCWFLPVQGIPLLTAVIFR